MNDKQFLDRMQRNFNADLTCPITNRVFIRIVAETKEEDLRNGNGQRTPYWRVIKIYGSLNEQFLGRVKMQADRFRGKGYIIELGKGNKIPQ